MKRSNIIVSSSVLLLIAWFLVSGWLQANAYNSIKSHRPCNYVEFIGNERTTKSLNPFKNLKIDFEKHTLYPKINIYYFFVQDISNSLNMNKQYSYKISEDTLCLNINYDRSGDNDQINIGVPVLNSVNITTPFDKQGTVYNDPDHDISISGFNANFLSIVYNCQYDLKLKNNKLKRLELRGNYDEAGKITITNYPDYDSLDVDMDCNHGSLVMSKKPEIRDNNRQWISVKVPQTFNIEAETGSRIWNDIIVKKSHHEMPDE